MSTETTCTWCGATPVFWRTTCERCYRIFERVERALKGTRFTSDERRLFTEAIIANPMRTGGQEAPVDRRVSGR
jgi:hypothetical protein